jgi:hypothetical protein
MSNIYNDDILVKNCLTLIEQKLNWGSSDKWRHSQFVKLNIRIEESTKTNLSYSTLKRVWGKLEYSGQISIATLDALCMFLGYMDWEDYVSKNTDIQTSVERKIESTKRSKKTVKKNRYILLPGILLIIITGSILIYSSVFYQKIDPNKVNFTADKTSGTIPFTVYFNTNLGKYSKDNFYIVTGDSRTKRSLKTTPLNYAGMYLRPGNHTASLYYKDTEIKSINILAETNGWNYLYKDNEGNHSKPLFETDIISDHLLHLAKSNANSLQKDIASNYFFIKRFEFNDESITFKTRLKNPISEGADECQKVGVSLLFENGYITAPLVKFGCEALAKIHINEYERSGFKDEEMQCFAADLNEWQDFMIKMENRKYSILINDFLCFEEQFDDTMGVFMGMRYMFYGTGLIVDYAEILNHDSVVFRDDFER